MSYNFTASDLKQLYGQRFKLPSSSSGEVFNAHIRPPARGETWPRAGAEALCTLLEVQRQSSAAPLPSVLKLFRKDLPHRNQRSTFLVKTAFARDFEWIFQGVPFSVLNGVDVGGRPIYAHLTKQIGIEHGGLAEDFGRLKEMGGYDGFDAILRRRFTGHLAIAVRVLEHFGFVHGDLSDSNAMIGPGPNGPVLCLCDFDGFFHTKVPLLPRRQRPLGSPGYQPPFFLDAVAADTAYAKDDLTVKSDRFALAVLACELMVWNAKVARMVGSRTRLLDDDSIRVGGLGALDQRILALWPEGFALLEMAWAAKSWDELPSPEEWLALLGVKTYLPRLPFRRQPFLVCQPARLDSGGETRRAEIGKSAGTFGPIHPDLAGLSYTFSSDRRFTLAVSAGATLLEGSLDSPAGLRSRAGPVTVDIGPKALAAFNGWRIEVHDGQPTATV